MGQHPVLRDHGGKCKVKTLKGLLLGFASILVIGGLSIFATYLIMVPGKPTFGTLLATFAAIGLIAQVTADIASGIGAKLGISLVRPRKWIRIIFRIPDDYRPSN